MEAPITEVKRRILTSLVSSFALQLIIVFFNVVAKLVLARFLLPEDFGLFAVSLLIVTIASYLKDFGISEHIIREGGAETFRRMLSLHLILSTVMMAFFIVGGDIFVRFDPMVSAILPILGLSLYWDTLINVYYTYLRKGLMLERAVLPELTGTASFMVLGIGLALMGLSVWSLVLAHIASLFIKALMFRMKIGSELRLGFDLTSLWSLMNRGRYFLLIALIGMLLMELDRGILGLLVPAELVGLYVMAASLTFMPMRLIEQSIMRVVYPLFSEASADSGRLRAAYRRFTFFALALEIPVYLLIAFNSSGLVHILLGSRWGAAAPMITALCFVPMVNPFSKFGGSLLQSLHVERFQVRALFLHLLFFIAVGYISARRFGVYGVMAAHYLNLGSLLITYYVIKNIGLDRDMIREVVTLYAIPLLIFLPAALRILPEGYLLPVTLLMACSSYLVTYIVNRVMVTKIISDIRIVLADRMMAD